MEKGFLGKIIVDKKGKVLYYVYRKSEHKFVFEETKETYVWKNINKVGQLLDEER